MAYDPKDPADVAIVDGLIAEATSGLTTKRDELLGEVKKLKKQISSGAADPAAVERLEADLEAANVKLEAATGDLKKVTKERDKFKGDFESESKFSRDTLVTNGLTDALASAKVASQFTPAVRAMFASKVEVKTEAGERKLFIGDKPLGEAITAWSQSDEGKHYIGAGQNSGGGSGGGGANTQGKSVNRAAFDAMDQNARSSHFADGGTVTD